MTEKDRQAGFTLIEVLVAFAVLSLGLVSFYSLTGNSLNRLSAAELDRQMLAFAETKMGEILANKSFLLGESSGTTVDGYTWMSAISRKEKKESQQSAGRSIINIKLDVQIENARFPRQIIFETQRLVMEDNG